MPSDPPRIQKLFLAGCVGFKTFRPSRPNRNLAKLMGFDQISQFQPNCTISTKLHNFNQISQFQPSKFQLGNISKWVTCKIGKTSKWLSSSWLNINSDETQLVEIVNGSTCHGSLLLSSLPSPPHPSTQFLFLYYMTS